MKTGTLLILIALMVPIMLFGQRVGIRVGVGAGNLNTTNKGQSGLLPDYQYSAAYSLDLSWWSKLSNKLFITSGIGFASISTKYKDPFHIKGQEDQKERLNLLYLKLPVRLKFIIADKFIPHIGPSFGYRIHEKVKNSLGYHHLFNQKFDYGLELGFGVKLFSRVIAGLSMYNGFSNVEKIECGNCSTSKAEVSRIRTFEFNLNYLLIK